MYVLTPMSSTIILSRPLGPNELFTTLAIACVASTAPVSPSIPSNSSAAAQRTVLVSNIGSRNLLAAQEKGAVPRLLKQGCHGCSCGVICLTVAVTVQAGVGRRDKGVVEVEGSRIDNFCLESAIMALAYLSKLRSSCNGGTCPAAPRLFCRKHRLFQLRRCDTGHHPPETAPGPPDSSHAAPERRLPQRWQPLQGLEVPAPASPDWVPLRGPDVEISLPCPSFLVSEGQPRLIAGQPDTRDWRH